jgi:hypothetical protein
VRPHDAVAPQVEPVLQQPDAVQRRAVVVGVDRDDDSLADEQELEDRDVPAERSLPQRPRPEERPAERPESELAMPVTGRWWIRWNCRTAATVAGPAIASIGPR